MLTPFKLKSGCIKILYPILILIFYTIPSITVAQIINTQTNVVFLKENAALLQQKLDNNRQVAFAIAKEKGWKTLDLPRMLSTNRRHYNTLFLQVFLALFCQDVIASLTARELFPTLRVA